MAEKNYGMIKELMLIENLLYNANKNILIKIIYSI